MSAPAPIFTLHCAYCGQSRHAREFVRVGTVVLMCWHCVERHNRALQMLAGTAPVECQECQVAIADLHALDDSGNVRMYTHFKDGVYQLLCQTCSDGYAQKRSDLYGSTEYGQQIQQKGV